MPVEVQVGTKKFTVDMRSGIGTFSAPNGVTPTIDPDARILMASPKTVAVEELEHVIPKTFDVSVYPNPFNPSTTLRIELPRRALIEGEIVSLSGERVAEIASGWHEAGTHTVTVNLGNHSSGVYFAVIRGEGRTLTRKLVLVK